MSAVSTSTFEAAFVTATDTAALEADAVPGVKNVSIERSNVVVETTAQGDQFQTFKPTTTTVSISMDGQIHPNSAPYGVIKSAFEDRSVVYLTVIENSEAGVGEEQGKRYAVYVESLGFSYGVGDLLNFDASFSLASASITPVLGA